jgi:two-component system osmolarity sensor histidine kinase EnvZ
MERMVEGYLAFARGEGAEQPSETDLSGLLGELADQMSRDGKSIDIDIDGELVVPLQRDSIRRCFTNLIANAQHYGDQVNVSAMRKKRAIVVTIDDNGPGIAPEFREEVFKPFSRLDPSRNPETGGTGLGLTIARDVARNHGGDLYLEDAPGQGLRARVVLPL